LATLRLRDRDAIVTNEGLVFRVFGYSHPPNACVCDVEYAPEAIFKSNNPKAFRNRGQHVFYKFYEDEGLKFIKNYYPQYFIFHGMLQEKVLGVNISDIVEVKKPDEKLREIMKVEPNDELIAALLSVSQLAMQYSKLSKKNFGVFGSLLHDFYHPKFSDLDFVIYGREKTQILRETLCKLYDDKSSGLRNEFGTNEPVRGKHWRFQNFSPQEYVWHQQRKLIYALFNDEKSGRIIKTEFEPVKEWKEASNEYDSEVRILRKGWVRMFARITDDQDALFIPSIYGVEPTNILCGAKEAVEVIRVVSFMEEFRMQAWKDERVYVEGNLEEVTTSKNSFHQITLTYCPRYYEQVLKVAS